MAEKEQAKFEAVSILSLSSIVMFLLAFWSTCSSGNVLSSDLETQDQNKLMMSRETREGLHFFQWTQLLSLEGPDYVGHYTISV